MRARMVSTKHWMEKGVLCENVLGLPVSMPNLFEELIGFPVFAFGESGSKPYRPFAAVAIDRCTLCEQIRIS